MRKVTDINELIQLTNEHFCLCDTCIEHRAECHPIIIVRMANDVISCNGYSNHMNYKGRKDKTK